LDWLSIGPVRVWASIPERTARNDAHRFIFSLFPFFQSNHVN